MTRKREVVVCRQIALFDVARIVRAASTRGGNMISAKSFLRERWEALWSNIPLGKVNNAYLALEQRYGEEGRAYHTLSHIEACLTNFDMLRLDARHPRELEVSLWYHDVIYDTHRKDNEETSVHFAKVELSKFGVPGTFQDRVERLILATKHNAPLNTRDEQLMSDIDLQILGEDPGVYNRYCRNIRREYVWVPIDEYKRVRAMILRSFLGRNTIFYSSRFIRVYEDQARKNLVREIAGLEKFN